MMVMPHPNPNPNPLLGQSVPLLLCSGLHWQIPHRIVLDFLAQTKSQLLEVLGCGDPELENVTILLKALQKSVLVGWVDLSKCCSECVL